MKSFNVKLHLALFATTFVLYSCDKFQPPAPFDEDLLDGPIEGLTYAENAEFLAGDIAFNDELFTSSTGLGPIFLANSCVSCHAGDGKGAHFGSLIRFGQTDDTGNQFLHMGGPQLQSRAFYLAMNQKKFPLVPRGQNSWHRQLQV